MLIAYVALGILNVYKLIRTVNNHREWSTDQVLCKIFYFT